MECAKCALPERLGFQLSATTRTCRRVSLGKLLSCRTMRSTLGVRQRNKLDSILLRHIEITFLGKSSCVLAPGRRRRAAPGATTTRDNSDSALRSAGLQQCFARATKCNVLYMRSISRIHRLTGKSPGARRRRCLCQLTRLDSYAAQRRLVASLSSCLGSPRSARGSA